MERIEKIACLSKSIMLFLSIICLQVIGLGLVSLIAPEIGLNMDKQEHVMIVSCIISVVYMLWVTFWYRMVEKDWVIVKQDIPFRLWVASLGLGVGACITFSFLLGILRQFIPDVLLQQYNDTVSGFTKITPVVLLYTVVLGPAAEEFVFRGMLIRQMRKSFTMNEAIVFQACLFGVYHLDVIQGIYAVIMGIILGKIYQKTGGLQVTIFTHILFNSTSYLLQILLKHSGKNNEAMSWGVFLAGAFLFVFALWYNKKSEKVGG